MAASTVAMSQHACVALNGGLCGSNVLSTRTESGVSFARTPLVKTGLAVERSAKRLVPISAHVDGLGATLPSGFEMTDYTVVDESFSGSLGGGIMEKIANGFKSFKENNFRSNPEIFEPLKKGQAPEVMIIACADSRVCPTMLHGLDAGEAFIVRSVANLVPAYDPSMENGPHGTSAAILYAVTVLGVKKVIVMGHSSCGGIKALMTMNEFDKDFVGSWVKIGLPAKESTLEAVGDKPLAEQCTFCEKV
uniref:Carbonic anhydrase n=1 Tax=Physcomitrium patens TaxID=3218 RepID=A0A7I4E4U4_PHYPA